MAREFHINIHEFLKEFNKQYDFLYDHNDNVAGYQEALEAGKIFLRKRPYFVRQFVEYRGDFISSDREVVAFIFALDNMME